MFLTKNWQSFSFSFQQLSEADKAANTSTTTLEASSSEITVIANNATPTATGGASHQCKKTCEIKAEFLMEELLLFISESLHSPGPRPTKFRGGGTDYTIAHPIVDKLAIETSF